MVRKDGTPKVGDKIEVPVSTKRDGANVKIQFEKYIYTENGWVDSKGSAVDKSTQAKITKAFTTPVGTEKGQYKYLGNGRWTDTNSYEGNIVAPTQTKKLFGLDEVKKTDNNKSLEEDGSAKKYTSSPEQPNIPQRNTITTGKGLAGGGSGSGKKEEAPVSTRETTVPEGIQTKSVLDAESLAGIFRRSEENVDASMPGLKDGSGTFTDTGEKKASVFGDLTSYAEYLPDFFKMGLGLLGANQKVPEYEIPKEFIDFKQKAREMSDQGLEAEELAKAYQDTERAYAYDTKAIRDMSGGRAGLALANLGRATDSLGQRYGAINAADAAMRRENRAQYGGVLADYVGLDRTMFEDKRQLALLNKEAGANLAADAMSNIDNRMEYNKTYGKGSVYERYMKQLEEGVGLQNDILRYQTENPPEVIAPNIQTIPMSPVPNFYGTYFGMGGSGNVN